ncbi:MULTISPECIES: hypothetical protein [unclassified Sinorhizobium]|uniref:hypothetical protein n=1 Tax=unclassified Sinorhizobium TaxID=2613772 RepID=UPI0024C4696C|nr:MULTISPECIES: hypothetical protein [unclassified Sinorhizobium]MDK1374118.1 hypothetical protein [Sinorhizobium sp. 6-70]MDK1477859.1 hypothetical protein [Sinorhizobium sp. 6-117]
MQTPADPVPAAWTRLTVFNVLGPAIEYLTPLKSGARYGYRNAPPEENAPIGLLPPPE